ncbi:MAG: K+/H+ antiporter subunit F [Proteobacteria bacterium]|nr:K+/H+ antiporter subunit F [Pseudomonadota bacterium]MBS0551215.1 K+/H+ antiporter subunit F [Pseudomonadota bacterium]
MTTHAPLDYALAFGFAAFALALLMNLVRLLKGPTLMDRVLAADTMVINVIALIVLLGIHQATKAHFEAALLFAMFGFVATVAFCRFMLRGRLID